MSWLGAGEFGLKMYVYLRFEIPEYGCIAKCLLTNTDVQKMFKDVETATTF